MTEAQLELLAISKLVQTACTFLTSTQVNSEELSIAVPH